jgi:hypothetical protein
MALAVGRRHNGSGTIVLRPFLLAGGLGLLWFVTAQEGGSAIQAPPWGMALVTASRLLVDVTGGALIVALLRILLALGRLGLTRLRRFKAAQAR